MKVLKAVIMLLGILLIVVGFCAMMYSVDLNYEYSFTTVFPYRGLGEFSIIVGFSLIVLSLIRRRCRI
jgi:hypothetical protein